MKKHNRMRVLRCPVFRMFRVGMESDFALGDLQKFSAWALSSLALFD